MEGGMGRRKERKGKRNNIKGQGRDREVKGQNLGKEKELGEGKVLSKRRGDRYKEKEEEGCGKGREWKG